jgi:hypothetical protein
MRLLPTSMPMPVIITSTAAVNKHRISRRQEQRRKAESAHGACQNVIFGKLKCRQFQLLLSTMLGVKNDEHDMRMVSQPSSL